MRRRPSSARFLGAYGAGEPGAAGVAAAGAAAGDPVAYGIGTTFVGIESFGFSA
jgi:hypothetical protein